MTPTDLSFPSHGEECAAWHLVGEGDAFAGERGRPCVLMATGMGGTKDSGLLPFAQAFSEAGLDSLLFDYRGFGASGGDPRQLASLQRHRADLRVAVAFARRLDGVDPDRIVLWGWSWGASHSIRIAAEDPKRIAALIAVTPEADGIGALRHLTSQTGPIHALRLTARGLRDLVAAARGRGPELIPLVGPPGSLAALTTPDSEPGYKALAGPSWRNEVPARVSIARVFNGSVRAVALLRCPILIQAGQSDMIAAPDTARKLAWRAKGYAEMREYPGSHFDLLGEQSERVIEHELHFLRRHLAGAKVPASTLEA